MNLSEHVRLLMQHAHDNPGDHKSTESYQATFEGEGTRKTEFIVDDLKRLERDRHLELSSAVAVSVGGADGSDLDSVLIGTPIREGFLIEYSDEGAEAARKRAEKLRTHGKTLSVMQGDATMRKKDLIPKLRELKQQGYTTLVLIFLGVLHELPKRSTQQYDLKSYVGTLCEIFPNNAIYISEPCTPINWPPQVELKIADLDTDLLHRWSLYIKRTLWENETLPEPKGVGGGYVSMPRELAAETLFKTIRRHDIARHLYEMGERLSSFDAEHATKIVRGALIDASVERTSLTSDGFASAYKKSDVMVRADDRELGMPESHVRIIAHSIRETAQQGGPALPTTTEPTSQLVRRAIETLPLPVLEVDAAYSIGSGSRRVQFFKEAAQLFDYGQLHPFRVELPYVTMLRDRLLKLEKDGANTPEQRAELLSAARDLLILEERTRRFSSVIDAWLEGKLRFSTDPAEGDKHHDAVAEVFEKAIRRVWIVTEVNQTECRQVMVHGSNLKGGPFVWVWLAKSEIEFAQKHESRSAIVLSAAEEFEGSIRHFGYETRVNTLYPAIISVFLRDGFPKVLPDEDQHLDNWMVSNI